MADMLVIDDNDDLRDTLRATLERVGYTVYEARNGREGCACCQAQPVALVIPDLLMPEQEGMETIQQLRAMDPPPKIITISGGGQTLRMDFLQLAQA